jgi:hypothetical protein
MRVLRSMIADEDGLPMLGKTGRYLCCRSSGKFRDLDIGEDGTVGPGDGGVSVSPPPVHNLHPSKRPPTSEHPDGYGEDPIFELETEELPGELEYRADPKDPDRHGFIEASRRMPFEEYQRAIQATRTLWRHV